jgi:hypothetical protein
VIQVHLVLNQDHIPRKNQNPKPKNEDQNDELQRRGEPLKKDQRREDELNPREEKQLGEKK